MGLLALLVSHTSACIIPLAPEWQDPLAAPNTPPFFDDVRPPFGSINVTGTRFDLVVSDLNIGDELHVRFVSDYPPYDSELTRPMGNEQTFTPPVDGRILRAPVILDVDCDRLSSAKTTHQLYVVLADREFTSFQVMEQVKPGGFAVAGSWGFTGCQ